MRKLILIASLLIACGCASEPSPAKKITHNGRVYHACRIWRSHASVSFDDENGNQIILYGDIVIENDPDYVCLDDKVVRK